MSEPFNLVAIIHPLPGKRDEFIEAFKIVSPMVHQEKGCEVYALNIPHDGDDLYMIERWTHPDDLVAHQNGAAMAKLDELTEHVSAADTDVILLDPVPLGEPAKGVIG